MKINKNIERDLKSYSKIDIQGDLKNLESDVNKRIYLNQSGLNKLGALIERWFGLPAFVSASAIAATLVLGIFLGTQVQTAIPSAKADVLGFEVFSASSIKLASSLSVAKL